MNSIQNLHGNTLPPTDKLTSVIPSPLASTSLKNQIFNNISNGKKSLQRNDIKRDKTINTDGIEGKSDNNQG